MKSCLAVILLVLVFNPAFAVVDPDPNSLGVYFDLEADSNYLEVGPATVFSAYVTLTNPTWDHVLAFEFGYELVVPSGMEGAIFRLADTLPPYSIDIEWHDPLGGDYIVGMGLPYPTSEATVLVHWVFLLGLPMTIEYFLGPSSPPSVPDNLPVIMNEDNVLMSVGISSGDVNLPVAEVNTGHQPVTVQNANWGSLKSLFR